MKLLAITAVLLASALTAAPAPLPPALPWNGASEALVAKPSDPWITPSEASGFATTPSYAETSAWLERLASACPAMKIESFGVSPQGRALLAITLGTPAPEKPRLLVQAGIHSGEIDGKDAGLMLLRDICLRGKAGLVSKVSLVFVPIFNVDGHERSSAFNRPNQRGPDNQGWRTTAQNLNLNREYVKADAPEMRAMLGLITRFDPDLILDLHVTDGTDYQYDITFGFNGTRYARSPAIGAWLEKAYRPAITAGLAAGGHIPGGLVFAIDDRNPDAGIAYGFSTPRFSDGYGDLRRMGAVLVENHSLKPYRQRVLGTYVLLESTLKLLASEGSSLKSAVAADRALRPQTIVATWRNLPAPIKTIPFLGVAHESFQSPSSGGAEIRWLGKPITQQMPVFGQEPASRIAMPKAWWVPATLPQVIERLRLHGIQFETLASAKTDQLEMLRAVSPKVASAIEGRFPVSAEGFIAQSRRETFPAGSVRVPADQPLGELAAVLLQPESPDSLFSWGFFPEILQRTEYIEGYAIAPMADAMLDADPALKAEFQAKLAADPAFAKNPDARLSWFYARTPYFDDRYLLYPIGIER